MTGFGNRTGKRKSASVYATPSEEIRAIALRLLARREHSRQELVLKLRQRGFEPASIEPILDEYEERDWLSDQRFADMLVRQRHEAGYGPLKIRADLQQKGITGTPQALSAVTEASWRETAVRARRKRFGLEHIREDWPVKARQAGFLSRRGFTSEQVEHALAVTDSD